MKNLRLHNVSIHRNFYQNKFINEYARKKKAKFSESRSFLVRYRRTYVLKDKQSAQKKSETGCSTRSQLNSFYSFLIKILVD